MGVRVIVGVAVGRSVRVGDGVNVGVSGVVDVPETIADVVGPGSSVRVDRGVGLEGNVLSTRGVRVGSSDTEGANVAAGVVVCEKI